MLAEEFSQEFDILYNNISSNQAPGLTEYEKSVFLTKAQDEIIKNYFTGKPNGNKYQEGIEDSAKRYSDFSCLITVATIPIDATATNTIDSRRQVVKLPEDLMISLNEKFEILKDTAAITLEKGFYPEINYFCIGNGGSTLASGVKGYTYSRHSALDAALFNHIPFVLRANSVPAAVPASKPSIKLV